MPPSPIRTICFAPRFAQYSSHLPRYIVVPSVDWSMVHDYDHWKLQNNFEKLMIFRARINQNNVWNAFQKSIISNRTFCFVFGLLAVQEVSNLTLYRFPDSNSKISKIINYSDPDDFDRSNWYWLKNVWLSFHFSTLSTHFSKLFFHADALRDISNLTLHWNRRKLHFATENG